jgi:hypothetical protein
MSNIFSLANNGSERLPDVEILLKRLLLQKFGDTYRKSQIPFFPGINYINSIFRCDKKQNGLYKRNLEIYFTNLIEKKSVSVTFFLFPFKHEFSL